MKKRGFTLAEVLITLGIIGIVAALTLPSLIANYQKQLTIARLKETTNLIAQMYTLSEANNGFSDTWELNNVNSDTLFDFLNEYIFPYIKTTKTCKESELINCGWDLDKGKTLSGSSFTSWSGNKAAAVLPNGTSLIFVTRSSYSYIIVFLDINGKAPPNILGKDVFRMNFYYNGTRGFDYGAPADYSRDELINTPNYGCKEGINGTYCLMLIMQDGWEIAPDYPW